MIATRPLGVGLRLGVSARFAAAIGLGLAAEALLYAAPVGWLYGVFVALLMIATLVFGDAERVSWPALAVALAGLIALIIEPHWGSFTLALLGVLSIALMTQTNVARDAWQWIRAVLHFTLLIPADFMLWLFNGERTSSGLTAPKFAWQSIARWLVPLGLTGVFALLFVIGNPLFINGAERAFDAIFGTLQVDPVDTAAGILRVAIIAMLCWPFLKAANTEIAASGDLPIPQFVSIGTVIRTLVLCNLLFGLQNFLDIVYLWGDGTLPETMTFSEYAHQGIYPLALAAILVGLFALFAMPAGGTAERHPLARGLVFLWLAQTGLLTLSCLKRLDLYVSVYSLTYLRIFAVIVTAGIGIGLIWIFLRVAGRKSNQWLLTVSTLTGLAMLFAGSILDVGGHIARYNVEHSKEVGGPGVQLDIVYLRDAIGPSAIPALAWFAENKQDSVGQVRWHRQGERAAEVKAALTRDFAATMTDWRAWTLRRHLLGQEIAALE